MFQLHNESRHSPHHSQRPREERGEPGYRETERGRERENQNEREREKETKKERERETKREREKEAKKEREREREQMKEKQKWSHTTLDLLIMFVCVHLCVHLCVCVCVRKSEKYALFIYSLNWHNYKQTSSCPIESN